MIKDIEDISQVNEQLEKMGHNIGVRLVDEFLAKSQTTSCASFKDTADIISKVAFKMFLGIVPDVTSWNAENTAFSLIFNDNPLLDFVELPPQYQNLQYCNVLCGVIKGALEMVQLQVVCSFVRDTLKGDDVSEMRVELKGVVKNEMGEEYQDD